jgi:hypothetical protein
MTSWEQSMKERCRVGPLVVAGLAVAGVLIAGGIGRLEAEKSEGVAGLDTPVDVYTAACSACHGTDGTGMPKEVLGFETPPPDFTDCSFATREPDADWFAIAHQGGPVRGFVKNMPALGEALSEAQLQMAVDHIRSFCEEQGWPRGDLNLPRPMITEKAFVEDEFVFTLWGTVEHPVEVMGEFTFEKRLGKKSQLEAVIPFGIAEELSVGDEQGGWVGGLGDIALGFKHVFAGNLKSGSIFSSIGEIKLPTAVPQGGLSSGHAVFEPTVSYGQSLGPLGWMQIQGGLEIPIEPGATLEALWRVVYGYTFTQGRFGRAWSPMVEVLGWIDLEGGATPKWDIVPQLQVALNKRQHVSMSFATRIPLESGHDRPIGVYMYLLWEWFDGGFAEGW